MKNILKKDTLASLRKRSGSVKQVVVALEMSVQEPAVSKLERKSITDASVGKLQKYIAAIGGKLDMSITLSDGTILTLDNEI